VNGLAIQLCYKMPSTETLGFSYILKFIFHSHSVFHAVADARELRYKKLRIQGYQFRVSSELVIDATLKGHLARFLNHSCEPNCVASITDGKTPFEHLKRVFIISQREIFPGDEITYDYQFPLELDPERRIPCSCGSKQCRGFMNWDSPESTLYAARNIPL